ncbi:hypothetical protein LZ31DRAFT_636863 [Colletotrichum somersetense]|nr:hypothetical protein LZ31DRAFT_636863 [Colletotrichum somersetense]
MKTDCTTSSAEKSSRNTGGSSRKIIELKFLRGSKLRTQEITAVRVEPVMNLSSLLRRRQ